MTLLKFMSHLKIHVSRQKMTGEYCPDFLGIHAIVVEFFADTSASPADPASGTQQRVLLGQQVLMGQRMGQPQVIATDPSDLALTHFL